MSNTALSRQLVESRILWSFRKQEIMKTPEKTEYILVMRGQAQDVYQDTCSTGMAYRMIRTDLFGDMVSPVAMVTITRFNKGGAKLKDHITAEVDPVVSSIGNSKGDIFFATEDEARRVIADAVQRMVDQISAPDGFMTHPRLTEAGKGVLSALARKKNASMDIEITTKIADRPVD